MSEEVSPTTPIKNEYLNFNFSKNPVIWLIECILEFNLRGILPDIRFAQNSGGGGKGVHFLKKTGCYFSAIMPANNIQKSRKA